MTAPQLFSCDRAVVKAHLVDSFADAVEQLLDAASSGSMTANDAEKRTWTALLTVGPMLLTALFAAMARHATTTVLAATDRALADVKMRMDDDYWPTIVTTMGPVCFPFFAFRDHDGLCVPARQLFPLHGTVCSSQLCLQWETALASDHPFRKAAAVLGFFTHGAVTLQDSTVRRHAVLVGSQVAREWMYQTPANIRKILRERATRDSETGRPLIYASTDAHALRRFVDETWAAPWKMSNGIRLWCIDANTGQTIHLGGEYTWGDCHEVARLFVALQRSGHLPHNGDYGDGLVAQIVLPTDGMDWIAEHVLPLFDGAISPLDPYHVVEQVADAARTAYRGSKKKVARVVKQTRQALGIRDRRGRTVARKGPRRRRHKQRHVPYTGSGQALVELLCPIARALTGAALKRFRTLLGYITRNFQRLCYGQWRRRGIRIGSGAMESQHRFASQLRLKRAGCRWTADSAQAILNNRMLELSGRWDEFWARPDLAVRLATAGGDR